MNLRAAPDDVITIAARSLVAADPSRGLRARVLSSLDDAPRARRGWWLAVPVAASLVVAASISGQLFPSVRLPEVVSLPRGDFGALTAPSTDPSRLARELATAGKGMPGPAASGAPAIAAAEAAWFSAALRPIATPDLAVPAVTQPPPVAVALLEIEALVAPPMAVRPLDADRDRRAP